MEEKGLFYYYGAMSCGKSTNLLQQAFNYRERGYEIVVLTSALDDRYGTGKVTSRIGIESEATIIPKDDLELLKNVHDMCKTWSIKALFVDECQFLSTDQIDILGEIVDDCDIPVFCYGIKTDFESKLFSGSKRLFEIADTTEELKNICACGKKAIFNARLIDSTEQVVIGGNDMYQSMCRHCYRNFLKNKA